MWGVFAWCLLCEMFFASCWSWVISSSGVRRKEDKKGDRKTGRKKGKKGKREEERKEGRKKGGEERGGWVMVLGGIWLGEMP